MKKNFFVFFIALAFSWVFSCEIHITSPLENELWMFGYTYTITWEKSGFCPDYVRLDLYNRDGYFKTIAEVVPNSGQFTWDIEKPYGKREELGYYDRVIKIYSAESQELLGESPIFYIWPSIYDLGDNPTNYYGVDSEMYPVIAGIPGAYGAQWKTDLYLINPLPEGENIYLFLYYVGMGWSKEKAPKGYAVHLLGGESVEFKDIVANLFHEEGAGILYIRKVIDGPFPWDFSGDFSTVRIYNDMEQGGTFGFMIPQREDFFCPKYPVFMGLKENSNYRTNLFLANISPAPMRVYYRLVGDDAEELGSQWVDLAPFELHGEFQIFRHFTNDPVHHGLAIVTPEEPDKMPFLHVVATVIDNRTGAPYALFQ